MNYDMFIASIKEKLTLRLENKEKMIEHKILGNNGVIKQSLIIENDKRKIHPCINMGIWYSRYLEGDVSINAIVEKILDIYKDSSNTEYINMEFFSDWNRVKNKIFCRLINSNANRELLNSVPSRDYLDLSVVYYVQIDEMSDEYGIASIQISNLHIKEWNVTEEDLFNVAWDNICCNDDARFENISKVIARLMNKRDVFERDKLPMYVLSNKRNIYGSIQLMNKDKLKNIREFLDDDYYILPSSIHEVLVLPISEVEEEVSELSSMVKSVNDNEVEMREILSYSIYRYRYDTGDVEIVA